MNIVIIGGGIGGLATAVALQQKGLRCTVYEAATTFQPLGAGIGIGSNAMLALQEMNVGQAILQQGMPLHTQRFFDEHLQELNQIDFTQLKKRFGEETIAIQRADLHQALYEAVDPSYFHFNKRVQSVTNLQHGASLTFTDGETIYADLVIGADGIHSSIRKSLRPEHIPRYAGYTCWRGISPNLGQVAPHISSEAWSAKGRFGWAPLPNEQVYWFACINSPANNSIYKNYTKEQVATLFDHFPEPVAPIIKSTEHAYFLHHDIYDLAPLNQFVFGNICLIGDAAHATTPNMGQGAGQAIEDAACLAHFLTVSTQISEALQQYEQKRRKTTTKVIRLSRQIGVAAQWTNPFLIKFRNKIFPFVPKQLLFWRLTFLFKQ